MEEQSDEQVGVRRSRLGACLLLAILIALALAVLGVLADRRDPSPPGPDGLVVLLTAPEVEIPFGSVRVQADPAGRPAFVVWYDDGSGVPVEPVEYSYPRGTARRLSGFTPAATDRGPFSVPEVVLEPPLDLDGDGVVDRVLQEGGLNDDVSIVRVRSGADGGLLFADRDVREYESPDRAYPLGDLDGDGYGELALVYPRNDRSYDLHPSSLFVTTRSWVAIISGARLGFPPPTTAPAHPDDDP